VTESLFQLTFPLAVPFWLLMIVAPSWPWTRRIISSPLIIVPPLLVYAVQVMPHFSELWRAVSAPSLPVLQGFFAQAAPAGALWAHLIAFDLFVGRWMFLDSRHRGIHPLIMAPILITTILLSPFGTLAYLLIRQMAPVRETPVPEAPVR
jgi:hypothetical protein